MPSIQLSPHFTLAELTHSDTAQARGIDNAPDLAAADQLRALSSRTLERIRHLCGDNPVIVSSGYCSPALNAAVGGATNGAHLFGCAADITIPGFGSVRDVCHRLIPRLGELEIDQLIDESGGGAKWVHVGRSASTPRQMALTIDNRGTRTGFA